MEAPIVLVPFPVLVVQTLSKDAPVVGSAMLSQTAAPAGQPGAGAMVVVAA